MALENMPTMGCRPILTFDVYGQFAGLLSRFAGSVFLTRSMVSVQPVE